MSEKMNKKNRQNSVLMGMLICIVIAFAVTLGGFAILRRQMAKTDLEETKEKIASLTYIQEELAKMEQK